jgi:hypothetical protein
MTEPKAHHFVPQFLLRRFAAADGRIFYLDKRASVQRPRPMRVLEVFVENRLYAQYDESGRIDNSVEFDLAKLDDAASELTAHILRELEGNRIPLLGDSQREVWDKFLYLMMKRSPIIRTNVATRALFDDVVDRNILDIEHRGHQFSADEKELFGSEEWRRREYRNVTASSVTLVGVDVMKILASRGLSFARIRKANKCFILGSQPILRLGGVENAELRQGHPELWLPISPNYAVSPFGKNHEVKVFDIDPEDLRRVNLGIFRQSDAVGSSSEQLLLSLVAAR